MVRRGLTEKVTLDQHFRDQRFALEPELPLSIETCSLRASQNGVWECVFGQAIHTHPNWEFLLCALVLLLHAKDYDLTVQEIFAQI